MPIEPELLQRYNQAGPRYTSYPSAAEFSSSFTAQAYDKRLAQLKPQQCISLYIHLPFCQRRCSFCGCHVIATQKREVAARYLEYLEREMELVLQHLPARPYLIQYHLGGGTPTYFAPEQLRALHEKVQRHFSILPDAEQGIELDPRATSHEHVDTLMELGFNRLSMGVQDFNPEVQAAIGRDQDEATTKELFEYSRQKGFKSINVDLIYGLPGQTAASFARSLSSVLLLRPDRVALYSYAHVPWVKGHQKKIDTALLPSADLKIELFLHAIESFQKSGYEQIGMDHFALPNDQLSTARRQHRLHRNFMGYTAHRTSNMIGLGISAIGEIFGAYVQNHKKLSTYYAALDAGQLPVERGLELSRDDRIRRQVISSLMCNFYLNFTEVQHGFNIRFADYFASELEALAAGPVADGLVRIGSDGLEVTQRGQLFIRNICMVFDPYLAKKSQGGPVFSRTV